MNGGKLSSFLVLNLRKMRLKSATSGPSMSWRKFELAIASIGLRRKEAEHTLSLAELHRTYPQLTWLFLCRIYSKTKLWKLLIDLKEGWKSQVVLIHFVLSQISQATRAYLKRAVDQVRPVRCRAQGLDDHDTGPFYFRSRLAMPSFRTLIFDFIISTLTTYTQCKIDR